MAIAGLDFTVLVLTVDVIYDVHGADLWRFSWMADQNPSEANYSIPSRPSL